MRVSSIRSTSVVLALGMVAIWTATATAYPLYRNTAAEGTDDCFQCHGSFLASPYRSCAGGSNNAAKCTTDTECPGGVCAAWSGPLHNVHRNNMLGVVAPGTPDPNRCNVCHFGSSKTPVFLNQSNGTTGFDAISCIGCHGRQQDRGARPADCVDAAASTGPCGDGAGLRQHHQLSGVTVCAGCHSDAVPANFTPVGEHLLPPYYFTPDLLHPLKPTNSCNPNGEEDFEASSEGLDNDGDLLYDVADPDCPTPTATSTPQATPTSTAATSTPQATPTATATSTPSPVPTPDKVSQKCQAAIIKSAAGFVQAKTKALQKCEDGVVKQKLSGPCPDQKATDAIAKAGDKLSAGIAKACGGKNKICETGGDDIPVAVIGWASPCPDFEDKGCSNAINDCGGIAECVECVGEAAVDQAIALYYDALAPTDPKSSDKREKSLNKCQGAIGKVGAAFLIAQSKALQKCWGAKIKGKVNECPDLKAADAVSKAALKLAGAINKRCAGKDKQPGGVGEDADFTPAEIGFPPTCMDVTFPGFVTPCGSTITDLQSLVSCVACVTRFKAGCADRAAAVGLGPEYPSECNP